VQGIGGDDRARQDQPVEQSDDHRYFVCLGPDLGLGRDQARSSARAVSTWTWPPSASLVPRTVLPSTLTGSSCSSSASAASGAPLPFGSWRRARPCPLHQPRPDHGIRRRGVGSGPPRQIAAFDGGAADGSTALIHPASRSAGTSATQSAIAVNERIPATTTAEASASTTPTG